VPAAEPATTTPRTVISESDPAISLLGVSKRYGQHIALEPQDLAIHEGEFFCLLGPSGCGKTTTLNLIGGFVAPTTGEIRIRGKRVDSLPPHRRNVNTVFQAYALFPHMTVRRNVAFGLEMARVGRTEARERVEEALRQVGLEDFGERDPGELSGGQQQRVAVARALVNRPAVLLLDEPLGALDLKLRKRLQVELSRIHREARTTFVYVTHDQDEAMAMADRIAVMDAGRVRQVGTPGDIYMRPNCRFVADFIGESNFVDRCAVPRALGGDDRPGVLLVRPELIQAAAPADAPEHALTGTVLQSAFLGDCTRISIDCGVSEDPLVVTIHRHEHAGAAPMLDDVVALWWDREDVVPLDEEHGQNTPEEAVE
jgi:ABC-type Fe3+/spermidine/putrescine transport system ATPase subunit